ncbi:MAG: fumarylacetoacetate hydrolase family protein [Thermomicrobiales bacterium]|nr:fumarylacetoacetate hydrolase family protein [Thermomicrobiales bacterium]
MKFVSYSVGGGAFSAGLSVNGQVVDLAAGAAALGESLPANVVEIIQGGDAALAIARKVEKAAADGDLTSLPEADVVLGAALQTPPTIYLLAGNYQSHIMEGGAPAVNKERINPRPFIKPNTAIIGTNDPILIPPDSDTLDYEIEIAAVIGKAGRHISVADADDHIAGYTVFNDVSARSLKVADGRDERAGDSFFDWLLGKWCDSFAAIGPYLVTKDESGDPSTLEMALRVNGELRQHSDAGEMIFSIPESIAFLSRFVTLRPGDMLCMGTPGGVGATTATYLKAGDVVVAEIDKLGTLTNPVQ